MFVGHRNASSIMRSSTKTSSHSSTLGGDIRVDRDDLSTRMLPYYCFKVRASGLEDLLSHGFDEPASLVAVGKLLLGGREHVEATNDHQILDHPGSYPIRTASHERVLEGHHLVADGRLGFALPTRRWGVHLFRAPPLGVRQRRRPVPHPTSKPIEGTQSPTLDPLAAPRRFPRRPHRCSRLWLTAPSRPIRCWFSRHQTTWPGVPSFLSAYEVSCRVRAERVKPYASSAKPASDSPRGPLREGPCGSPAPRRHPGVRHPSYAVVTHRYTPRRAVCQRP